jgi:hypothetical protein
VEPEEAAVARQMNTCTHEQTCGLSLGNNTPQHVMQQQKEVEVQVNLRPTVSRTVCLGVGRSSGTRDQFFFLL